MKLEKLAEKEITIRSLGVLSFSKRKKDTLSFFLLKGTFPEDVFEESFLKDKDNYLSMKRPETAKLFSSRFVRDKEKNGVYLYSLDNQLVFAPRDTRTGETSAFVKDLSMLLGIGMPDTSFGNLARDLYLAEKLNDTGKEIAVCYCTQETVGNVVRPIGAVEVPREPVWDRHRRYATEAAEKKQRNDILLQKKNMTRRWIGSGKRKSKAALYRNTVWKPQKASSVTIRSLLSDAGPANW